jgi:hypothetical protein
MVGGTGQDGQSGGHGRDLLVAGIGREQTDSLGKTIYVGTANGGVRKTMDDIDLDDLNNLRNNFGNRFARRAVRVRFEEVDTAVVAVAESGSLDLSDWEQNFGHGG